MWKIALIVVVAGILGLGAIGLAVDHHSSLSSEATAITTTCVPAVATAFSSPTATTLPFFPTSTPEGKVGAAETAVTTVIHACGD